MTVPPPRAAAFIVTLYGDVVEPRGGTLWTGHIIAACAAQGLSEGVVRTALSRLVSAGRLEGVRIGRRSCYRLTADARAEFAPAARAIYDPGARPTRWLVGLGDLPDGWVRLGEVGFAPLRPGLARPETVIEGPASGDMRAVGRLFGIEALAADYAAFRAGYGGDTPMSEPVPDPLAARLRMVHDFRLIALRDPRLPVEALPEGWAGDAARALFARRYLALSDPADRAAARWRGEDGPLPETTASTEVRAEALRKSTKA